MIAEGWKKELPENHRIALDLAYSDFLDGYFHLSRTEDEKLGRVTKSLPQKYITRYSPLFCRRFIISMSSVAERLVQLEQIAPLPRSTAEAMALHILIEDATTLLRDVKRIDADYNEFKALAFRDTEFLSLYETNPNEPADNPTNHKPLPNNLEFADWFKPFDSNKPVNPFVYEDWTTEQACLNFER